MKYFLTKVKVFTPEKDHVIEVLIQGETFTDVEATANEYISEQYNEFKVQSIVDAKIGQIIDTGEYDGYVILTASWISVDDKLVKENVAIKADTVQIALDLFKVQTDGMVVPPKVESIKMTKIVDRVDSPINQTELFKSFEHDSQES